MRNEEKNLVEAMKTDDAYSGVVQTISDFGMAITIKFKKASQTQWFHQAKVEIFVSVSRHVHTDKILGKSIITCSHIFFSDSKYKNGDDIGHYHELMIQRLQSEFNIKFTHFFD